MLKDNVINYIAKKHIAGPNLDDALSICKLAENSGWSTTISVWTGKDISADENAKKYQEIILAIIDSNLTSYVSIKPPAINFDLKRFDRIAKLAASRNIRIHFDSLSPDLADNYLKFLKGAKTIYPFLGYTLPSRWNRSLFDAELISRLNIPVRIVKGQWPEFEHSRIDSRKNFIKLINILAERVPLIGIATHEKILAERAIEIITKTKTPYELEQFFSLPFIDMKLAQKYNFKKRLYVVYGEAYLPYNLRSINKRPAMLGWVLKDILDLKSKGYNNFQNIKKNFGETHELS